jgi:hypothetical protein
MHTDVWDEEDKPKQQPSTRLRLPFIVCRNMAFEAEKINFLRLPKPCPGAKGEVTKLHLYLCSSVFIGG